ncbi:MAG TPA: thioredoxin family protein [Mucilaginibacter sp.]|jgi:thiol-disulfide isomerase/thioredoxin|nr:thioredoxin family protein [Mucilaginibacter sp.]
MKIKHQLFVLIMLINSVALAQPAPPPVETVLSDAYAQAAKENKKVILIFHASWCGWCRRMEALINDPSCKKIFDDNYVIARLDVLERKGNENLENPGSLDVLKKYKADQLGLPFWLVLDANGNILASSLMKPDNSTEAKAEDNVGCPSNDKEVAYFTKLLKSTSNLSDEDLTVIYKTFLLKPVKPSTK